MEITYIPFHQRKNDTGALIALEENREIPFPIQRIYYIYDVAPGARRGFHAHKKLHQVLISIHGSCKILLDDGRDREIVELTGPDRGLLLHNTVWREMYDFSPGAVLLVLASDYYDETDYIRDYDEFLSFLKRGEHIR